MLNRISLFNGKVLRAKFTVEERQDGMFIATQWLPDCGAEEDRDVQEFETYSAARSKMFENALHISVYCSNLRISSK